MVAGWTEQDRDPWGDQSAGNGWDTWFGPEQSGPLPLYETLSETFASHNSLATAPAHHLLLGLNASTGAPEFMDLARPRTFAIKDSRYIGQDILHTMATAIKWRANQAQLPITAISYNTARWYQLQEHYNDVKVLTPNPHDGEVEPTLRSLMLNKRNRPHFLIIDNLSDMLDLSPDGKSILRTLMDHGAASKKVYILTCHSYQRNINSRNILDGWLKGGHFLHADTPYNNTIELDNSTNIWVPASN